MPGLTRASQSASSQAVEAKQRDLVDQYSSHRDDVAELRQRALEELLPDLCEEFQSGSAEDGQSMGDEEDVEARVKAFLSDDGESKVQSAM